MENDVRDREKKSRKVDNLINIVEKHTRTQRHLEQYSDIGDPIYKEKAIDKQHLREQQIDELKDQLVGIPKEPMTANEQFHALKQNFEFADDYMEKNKDRMDKQDLENLQKKQQHRKEQMENLEDNI